MGMRAASIMQLTEKGIQETWKANALGQATAKGIRNALQELVSSWAEVPDVPFEKLRTAELVAVLRSERSAESVISVVQRDGYNGAGFLALTEEKLEELKLSPGARQEVLLLQEKHRKVPDVPFEKLRT